LRILAVLKKTKKIGVEQLVKLTWGFVGEKASKVLPQSLGREACWKEERVKVGKRMEIH
jgi:hypothetical protein